MEKSKTKHKICDAANLATAIFPGVEHGINRKHELHDINGTPEVDIKIIPSGTLKLCTVGAECVDFCKRRLLPDRKTYTGPKTPPGKDPRPGLDGKYGSTFRAAITIWGWILKHHSECKCFFENGIVDDANQD